MQAFQPTRRSLWALLAPSVLVYGFIVVVPVVVGIWFSFHEMRNFQMEWAGVANYARMAGDGDLWFVLGNNVTITGLAIFFQVMPAFFIAVLMNRKDIWAEKFVRTAVFLPVVISPVVTSFVWILVFNLDSGLLNSTLAVLGLEAWQQRWLDDPEIVIYSLTAVLVWQYIGLFVVIFLAGLSAINPETLEAADVDGASFFQTAVLVVLPQMSRTVAVAMVLALSGGLKIFEHPLVMTGGGPGLASTVVAQFAYDVSFRRAQFGYGATIAITITVLSLVTVLACLWIINRLTVRSSGETDA
ncbi:MAG: sugar ABC transporter permease [Paracoccaceae bacterium]|nr:sugar ABC transporter permease [Paracoccaceae bacterium]